MHGRVDRRGFLTASAAALVAAAVPYARSAEAQGPGGLGPIDADGTLQAFADTILPGRRVDRTESGRPVHPQAILGLDPDPGAVEADTLALYQLTDLGFPILAPPFLADLQSRALAHGGPFLGLGADARTRVTTEGLSFDNPGRVLWEAAAAIAFTAFCAAGFNRTQRAETACGYRVMGLPGVAPHGYPNASYRRRLGRERTRTGNLP